MPQFTVNGTRRGFTLIELLVVITIIGILAAIALPNYIKAKDKAKEVQVKSAVHSIQVAIERYNVDFEEYPLFLLGGDVEGWRNWHQKYDEPNPSVLGANAFVRDPLVGYSYVDSYPQNPFVDDGSAMLKQTGLPTGPGGTHQGGDGDPRFGFRGNVMGNGCENPMTFFNWYDDDAQNIETERTLLAGTNNDPTSLGFGTRQSPSNKGLHYSMGGRRAVKVENGQNVVYTAFTHWPGNFFYRGFPERLLDRKGWTIWFPQAFIKSQTSRYIMGAYGSYTSEGTDLIRNEERNNSGGAVYYQLPPPWSSGSNLFRCTFAGTGVDGGLPEIAGGGNDTLGPWLPPDRSPDFPGAFIYGAPDGYPDAVILTLVAGEEVQAY